MEREIAAVISFCADAETESKNVSASTQKTGFSFRTKIIIDSLAYVSVLGFYVA